MTRFENGQRNSEGIWRTRINLIFVYIQISPSYLVQGKILFRILSLGTKEEALV